MAYSQRVRYASPPCSHLCFIAPRHQIRRMSDDRPGWRSSWNSSSLWRRRKAGVAHALLRMPQNRSRMKSLVCEVRRHRLSITKPFPSCGDARYFFCGFTSALARDPDSAKVEDLSLPGLCHIYSIITTGGRA